MKKLMIAAAIVCAAAYANAASGWWSTGDIYYNGVGSQLIDDAGDYEFSGNGYLFFLTAAQYASIEQGDAASLWSKFDAANNTLDFGTTLGKATFKASEAVDYGAVSFGNLGEFSENVLAAVIVTHEGEGGVVDAYSANTIEVVASPTALTGAGSTALNWGNAGDPGMPTTWQSVPEPTSGLLLLLGVAGLALRRRRA